MTTELRPAPPPTRMERARLAVGRRVREELDSPLLRNANALIINSAGTAVLGAAYWFVAARLYTPEAMGRGSAAISVMMLLAGLVPLNLPRVLTRLIPMAGTGTGQLVVRSYVFTAVCAALAAGVFLVGVESWSSELAYLRSGWVTAGWFVVAVMAWAIFHLQDFVLTGLRSAVWVPLENAVFGAVKLVLLAWFALLLMDDGVFVSWTIPVLLCLVPVNVLIFRRLIPRHVRSTGYRPPEKLGLRALSTYMTGDYVGELFTLAAYTLLPPLVLSRFGAETSAYFYAAWTASWTISLVADNLSAALTVEGSFDRTKLADNLRRALRRLVSIVIPLSAVLILTAPLILGLYGAAYADAGAPVLRIMALAMLPHSLIWLHLGALRARGMAGQIAAIQGVLCVLMLGGAVVLMGPLGIAGVGWAWLGGHVVVAAWVFPSLRRALRGDTAG